MGSGIDVDGGGVPVGTVSTGKQPHMNVEDTNKEVNNIDNRLFFIVVDSCQKFMRIILLEVDTIPSG